jgi:hypothetical protein
MSLLDLSGVTEQGTPIPDGTYSVIVEKAEVSPTKTGGEMIKVQYKIKEGPHSGRNIFDQFNIKNQNPQAVQIGLGQLKGMMKSFGHANVNKLESTKELVGLKGLVTVKNVDDGGQYGSQTKIRAYKPLVPDNNAATSQQGEANSSSPANPAPVANPFG